MWTGRMVKMAKPRSKKDSSPDDPEEGPKILAAKPRRTVDLVTGPSSGIGARLIHKLLERGDEVRVVVHEEPGGDNWKLIPRGVIPYNADITLKHSNDRKNLEDACRGVNNLFHIAGITDEKGNPPYEQFININVVGTENVLDAFVGTNGGAQLRFVYMGSTAVYGQNRPHEILTEESATKPVDPYGETKLMAEHVIKSFAEVHDYLRYTIFRVSKMYGPRYEAVFHKVFRYLKEGKLVYIGKGDNHLNLVHVDDVVNAMLLAAEMPMAINKTYNLTDGENYTLKQLFDKAANFMNIPPPTKSVHPMIAKLGAKRLNISKGELDFMTSDRVISIDKIKADLNFTPKRKVDVEGYAMVKEFLEGYKG